MSKQYLRGFVTKINDEDFTLEVAIASDGSKDRQGEIIDPNGWGLENFKRNPVLQWAHDYRTVPIGKVEEIKVVDGRLLFRPRFAAHIDEFAAKVWQMFKEGYLNAFSVGFQPIEAKKGDTYPKVELLEISAVPVPANPNALVMARELGLLPKSQHDGVCDPESPDYDPDKCAEMRAEKVEPEVIGERIHVRVRNPNLFVDDSFRTIDISAEQGIQAVIGKLTSDPDGSTVIQKYLFDVEKWTVEEAVAWVEKNEPDFERGMKTVVDFEATPTLPEGIDWDADAAETRIRAWAGGEDIDFDKYARGFAWFDGENPELLGSYKLPHHDVREGELKTHWRGVTSSMAVLLGSRGGVDIPDDDKRRVYSHLARHYEQYDTEPPEFVLRYTEDELKKIANGEKLERKAIHGHVTDVFAMLRERFDEGIAVVINLLTDHLRDDANAWADSFRTVMSEAESALHEAADEISGGETSMKEGRVLSARTTASIHSAIEGMAQATDALQDLLKNASAKKDNDGSNTAVSVEDAAQSAERVLRIVQRSTKQAVQQLEKANRVIKIATKKGVETK